MVKNGQLNSRSLVGLCKIELMRLYDVLKMSVTISVKTVVQTLARMAIESVVRQQVG